jgi:ElaB/YqjD/DUF883 family membrane-anchored ribosome-binding protein
MQEQSPREGQRPEESHSVETPTEGVDVLKASVQHTTDTAKVAVQQARDDLMAMIQDLDHTVQELRPTVDQIIKDVQGTVQRVIAPAKSMAACLEQMQQNPWTLVGTAVAIAYLQFARPSRSSTPGQEHG